MWSSAATNRTKEFIDSMDPAFSVHVPFLPGHLPLPSNPCGFSAIVDQGFQKPWVLQRVFGRDPRARIVYEDSPQQVEKLLIEGVSRRDNVLSQG